MPLFFRAEQAKSPISLANSLFRPYTHNLSSLRQFFKKGQLTQVTPKFPLAPCLGPSPQMLAQEMYWYPLRTPSPMKNSLSILQDVILKAMMFRFQENSPKHLRNPEKLVGLKGPKLVPSASSGSTTGVLCWVSLISCRICQENVNENSISNQVKKKRGCFSEPN